MMTKMMKSTVRVIIAATMMIALTFVFAQATVNADEEMVGTVERNAEVREEALAEKATSNTADATTVEPVVEGATGATEVKVQTVEEIEAEITAKNQAPAVEEVKAVETEVVFEEGTTAEEIEEGEYFDAKVVDTENAPATSATIQEISYAKAEASADEVAATYAEATAPTASNVAATSMQIVGGQKVNFTVIGRDTFFNHLQEAIETKNICYPTSSMTTGVKYFAGHNPGTMSNMNTVKVGSVVRLSNADGYQDYRIVEQKDYKAGSYSFADIKFNNSKSGANLWAMIQNGTENAIVIQFCVKVNGVGYYRYTYGQAI